MKSPKLKLLYVESPKFKENLFMGRKREHPSLFIPAYLSNSEILSIGTSQYLSHQAIYSNTFTANLKEVVDLSDLNG